MPLVNYCRKCKAETPVGESCPYCGGKLTQTGEQISFGTIRLPHRDWFAWNQALRIVLPVMLLAFLIVVAAEAAAAGMQGVIKLLTGGFLRVMVMLLAGVTGFLWLAFKLQGTENVHVVMDKQGVCVRTYVPRDNMMALRMRMMNEQIAEKLAQEDERPELDGLVLVRKVMIPWGDTARVQFWEEESAILFYKPFFWLAAAVRVPVEERAAAEEFVRKKLKRNKKVRIPPQKEV